MLVAGELNDAMGAIDIASFETTGLAKKLEAVGADFPNLKSLFKLTDVCECEQCRSVYSPAAYLVEILQFLHNRVVTDTVHVPPVTTNIAKEVLFSRRPDLGEIDLSCSNANTPLKYIDLVCELLEEAIAPDRPTDPRISSDSEPLGRACCVRRSAGRPHSCGDSTRRLSHHDRRIAYDGHL